VWPFGTLEAALLQLYYCDTSIHDHHCFFAVTIDITWGWVDVAAPTLLKLQLLRGVGMGLVEKGEMVEAG
jgi:hypothetical protein